MTTIALAVAVAASWLACLGYARLRSTLDRLHCIAFMTATCGFAVLVAALASEGLSPRALKIAVIWIANLLSSAATSQATASALLRRGSVRLPQGALE